MKKFSWGLVADMVEDFDTGFDFVEYDDYVLFDCPGVPEFEEIPKEAISSWEDLRKYFEDVLNNFDTDEFCFVYLKAKKNGLKGVPGIHDLVSDADYIIECLGDLIVGIRSVERAVKVESFV